MKTSYTLFGVLWDNVDVSKTKIRYVSWEDIADIEDYTIGFNLFDNPEYNRKISIQKLLSINDEDSLTLMLSPLQSCNNLYITADYIPRMDNKIVRNFLTKRTLQIYTVLQKLLYNTNIYLAISTK